MPIYWIWFAQMKKLSCAQKWQLLQHFHDPEDLYHCDEQSLLQKGLPEDVIAALEDKDLTQAQDIFRECMDKGIHLLSIRDEEYPQRLRNTYDPPVLLYFKGVLPDWNHLPAVGIVGTRKATSYGLGIARRFGSQIADCGALVISGVADGIDAMAMQGALDAGKSVVGVLGCGVDIVYPRKNQKLFDDSVVSGCLISEYPPREPAQAWHFPQRNRIISGISNALLVVEAPEKSGALITARYAWEQGRDVFVVPGQVDSPYCAGSNALLQERAAPALTGWDVVKEYADLYPGKVAFAPMPQRLAQVAQEPIIPAANEKRKSSADKKSIDNREKSTYSVVNKPEPALTQEERDVLARVDTEPKFVDELLEGSQLNAGAVKAILTKLAIKGLIQNHPGGRVSRK